MAWLDSGVHPSPHCVDRTFLPPFPVSASTNLDTDSSADVPDILSPADGRFFMMLLSAVAGWPHKAVMLGSMFTVRDTDTAVTVTATLNTGGGLFLGGVGWVSGFPYAHAWSQLNLTVDNGTHQVAASGPATVFDIATSFEFVSTAPAPGESETFTLTCSFTRAPGDPVGYVATVQGSVDLTTLTIGGAAGQLGPTLERIHVHACS